MELQKYLSKFLNKKKVRIFSERETFLRDEISRITGSGILNPGIYHEAFSLKTSSPEKNYERLEFLGDSILGSIISCYLFEVYPNANEGFLTQMKAKIVNRKNLNKIGADLNLINLVGSPQSALSENICGNLFEAFIGAIYLDLGYEICRKTVLERLLPPQEISKLEHKIVSYKGLLLEWSQKKKCALKYETCEEILPNKTMAFRSVVWMGSEKVANAAESSKKKAEEKAAQRAFYMLNKKENIIEKHKAVSG